MAFCCAMAFFAPSIVPAIPVCFSAASTLLGIWSVGRTLQTETNRVFWSEMASASGSLFLDLSQAMPTGLFLRATSLDDTPVLTVRCTVFCLSGKNKDKHSG